MGVTIRDLSKRCGLSVSAISKALNNYPDVSEATRARVLKVANEMGYFPNALARGLKTNRTYNLGVLLDDALGVNILHPYFAIILNSFRREAERAGYDITLLGHGVGTQPLSYLNHCRQRNVDGICLVCVNFYHPEVIELSQSELPLVSIDHPYAERDCVLSDNRGGMRALLEYALGMGHRRIAYIYGEPSEVTVARKSAFLAVMQEHGLEPPEPWMISNRYLSTQHVLTAVGNLLSLSERPTCILMSDDYSALGGLAALGEWGLRVPEDISVAGYDGTPMIQKIRPRLTTVQQNSDEIGRRAAQKLIARIERPDLPVGAPDVVPGTLLQGETIKRITE